ncbi:MAG TPA: helix-turn-helix transcriptional regulator [Solirubrobacteraceae bacterium]|nr:helix-turn-helix transcriptional regulator [Solirubrobacteraceae bacterium]
MISWKEHYGVDALDRVIHHACEDLAMRGRRDYAARIRAWRLESWMTLRQLARGAGTSASRLSDYEKAKVAPTTNVLGRIEHAASMRMGSQKMSPQSKGREQ